MTDYDKLKQLLNDFEVEFDAGDCSQGKYIDCCEGSAKVEGYSYFYTTFIFDSSGKFLYMGAYER